MLNNHDHLKDLLSLCAEIISKYNKELSHVEDSELKLWDNFIDTVDAASAAYGLSHALNDPNRCHECGSTDWDYANIGFTNAVTCLHCGSIRMKKE